MRRVIRYLRSIGGKGAALAVLLAVIITLAVLTNQTNQQAATYYDPHLEESPDASVVALENSSIFDNTPLSTLWGRVVNAAYQRHYEATGKLERRGKIVDPVRSQGGGQVSFTMAFQPSQARYRIIVTIKNLSEKDFSLHIERVR